MLTVRRTLTEILLDVTTEQILSVCKEELSRNRSHAQGIFVVNQTKYIPRISRREDSATNSADGTNYDTPPEKTLSSLCEILCDVFLSALKLQFINNILSKTDVHTKA